MKEIGRVRRLTSRLLDSLWDFMRECNQKAGRGLVGELLLFDGLLRRFEKSLSSDASNNVSFLGSSKKGYDIEIVVNGRICRLNAKGTTETDENGRPRWVRQHARNFVEITVKNRRTRIKVRQDYESDLFHVFIDVGKWIKTSRPDFYLLSDADAKNVLGWRYKKCHHNKAVRKNNSDDMWVTYRDIRRFRNNSLSRLRRG